MAFDYVSHVCSAAVYIYIYITINTIILCRLNVCYKVKLKQTNNIIENTTDITVKVLKCNAKLTRSTCLLSSGFNRSILCRLWSSLHWVVPEKIHTPPTDGILEILAGGGGVMDPGNPGGRGG